MLVSIPRLAVHIVGFLALVVCAGCGHLQSGAATGLNQVAVDNPLFVATGDLDFLWNQVVDAVDDDYRIAREQRPAAGAEGAIETYPTTGATVFEPWRNNSAPGYQQALATLQSIRRRASLRVAPAEGGYLIHAQVTHELEDVNRPENSTVGGQTIRYDGSIEEPDLADPDAVTTLGWIPLGRDAEAERRLLADIYARLSNR